MGAMMRNSVSNTFRQCITMISASYLMQSIHDPLSSGIALLIAIQYVLDSIEIQRRHGLRQKCGYPNHD